MFIKKIQFGSAILQFCKEYIWGKFPKEQFLYLRNRIACGNSYVFEIQWLSNKFIQKLNSFNQMKCESVLLKKMCLMFKEK